MTTIANKWERGPLKLSIIVDHDYIFRDKASYLMAVVFLQNLHIVKGALKDCAELDSELG